MTPKCRDEKSIYAYKQINSHFSLLFYLFFILSLSSFLSIFFLFPLCYYYCLPESCSVLLSSSCSQQQTHPYQNQQAQQLNQQPNPSIPNLNKASKPKLNTGTFQNHPKPTNKLKSNEPKTNDSNPSHTDLTTHSHHRFNNPTNTQTTTTDSNPTTTEGTHIDSILELKSSQHWTQQPPSLHDSPPTTIHHTNPSYTNPLHNPSPPLQKPTTTQTHCTTRPALHKPTAQTQCRSEEKRKGRRENERRKEEKMK